MALYTTNLTFHADASTANTVWSSVSASTPWYVTNSSDGDQAQGIQDVDGKAYSLRHGGATDSSPTYRTVTPLMYRSCADFDGTNDWMRIFDNHFAASVAASTFVGASAKTIIAAVYLEGAPATNAGNGYDSTPIVALGQYGGVVFRDIGGGSYRAGGYNWDGANAVAESADTAISLTTNTVVMMRHDGSNIYCSVNGGTEASVASGATSVLTGDFFIGENSAGTKFFNGRLGEIAVWNACLTGSNLSDSIAYFTGRWLTAGTEASLTTSASTSAQTAATPGLEIAL